jgi:hypothetical protein
LNGGLFDEHEIEKEYEKIQIDDKAFERLFDFFDEWNWHLDTSEAATGRDINPDVIGYIFEKYINDRAQMGAYYTKEDITDYISKNCVIPWLFDETKRNYNKAFLPDAWLWQMVKGSGTEYIYDAVKYGISETGGLFDDLSSEIQKGFNAKLENKVVDGKSPWLWELRKEWNKPAPSQIALPTEIYREVIERRKRYADIKSKITQGEVREINDFITYNLNIRQFAQDAIEDTADPDFIRHFYKALSSVTILDPTCGSGAFLFAALNILEPLYETCIQRMQEFVKEGNNGKYKFFEDTLKQVNAPEHPNLQYFIYKSIILNNLYGVDIMNEAVEIAKLRLFLKLVATVAADYRKENLGLEPLPDVDFNIRAGNTLVGYATKNQIDDIAGMFVTEAHKIKILEQCDVVALAFKRYKEIQLGGGDNYQEFKAAKEKLNERLIKLTDDLDNVLYLDQYNGEVKGKKGYIAWLETHKPFHWFAEYYEIVQGRKGFDVVIGNPPYVEKKDVTSYEVVGFVSETCNDLYAYILERATILSCNNRNLGFIVPLSCFSVERFRPLQNLLVSRSSNLFVTHWSGDAHPSKLFEGVDKRVQIVLARKTASNCDCQIYTSKYQKWYAEERSFLFDKNICYTVFPQSNLFWFDSSLPKFSSVIEIDILKKLLPMRNCPIGMLERENARNKVYYTRKVSFFLQFLDFIPLVKDARGKRREPSELKVLSLPTKEESNFCLAALSSSLFYWFNTFNSDCRNLNKREITAFPIGEKSGTITHDLFESLLTDLMESYQSNSELRTVTYKGKGEITVQYFNFRLSKPIIDKIDALLAAHYCLTHAEIDFIINYDIKYRMGKELEGGEDE